MSTDRPPRDRRHSDPQAQRLRVARIGRPHGVRGEVTVQLFTDEPETRLAPGAELTRTPGRDTEDRGTTTLTVRTQRWNKDICLLGFEEVADRSAAEALRGSQLHIDVADDHDEGWYSHQIAGLSCLSGHEHDRGESLGTAEEILPGPAQDLLVVRTPDGGEVLVPLVQELVPTVDPAAGHIILTPPPGLFPAEDPR
ncbi:ribosome maturation factor RimM [Nesterenkonia marinintestina]|uniref:ribosome maturation factor RimM n=1 Tax=Nesterenkonia marinintestina TaxID=2979865 RepID=UPI0021C0FD03|nr:ribosome maturation factor RimM [Nesterenkonia sp. GX14115]